MLLESRVERQHEQQVAVFDRGAKPERDIFDHPAVLKAGIANFGVGKNRRQVHRGKNRIRRASERVVPRLDYLEEAIIVVFVLTQFIKAITDARPVGRILQRDFINVGPREVEMRRRSIAEGGVKLAAEEPLEAVAPRRRAQQRSAPERNVKPRKLDQAAVIQVLPPTLEARLQAVFGID